MVVQSVIDLLTPDWPEEMRHLQHLAILNVTTIFGRGLEREARRQPPSLLHTPRNEKHSLPERDIKADAGAPL